MLEDLLFDHNTKIKKILPSDDRQFEQDVIEFIVEDDRLEYKVNEGFYLQSMSMNKFKSIVTDG
jgi:hypothetical protein